MKILATALCYNEINYIEDWVNYYRGQNCELFVLDNYSNDGTYEWLVDNKIAVSRCDTQESFHLRMLQDELNKQLAIIKPDWVVYTGIDSRYHFASTIRAEVVLADILGANLIEVNHFSMYNTGEERNGSFADTYFYGNKHANLQMIGKYIPKKTVIVADSIKQIIPNVFKSVGVFINYGMCKNKEEREVTFARRKRAWELGLTRGYGTHYQPAHDKDWLWDKKHLRDIRTTEFEQYIKR